MRPSKVLTFLVPMLLGLSLPTWAQPAMPPPGPGKPFFFVSTGGGPPPPPPIIPPIMMGLQAAHLTADQQDQVNQILQSNHAQVEPLIQQLQSIHEQIADKLLAPGTVTASDLAPLEDQAAQLDAKIQQQALNASVKIRSLLTSDQLAQMAQFHKKMGALQSQMRSLMSQSPPEQSAP